MGKPTLWVVRGALRAVFAAIGRPYVASYGIVRFLPVVESTDVKDERDVIEPFLDSMFEKAKDGALEGSSDEPSLSVSITGQVW